MDAVEGQTEQEIDVRGVRRIVDRLGGISPTARGLGHKNASTVQGWVESGIIPAKHHLAILELSLQLGIRQEREDFVSFPLDHAAFDLAARDEAA